MNGSSLSFPSLSDNLPFSQPTLSSINLTQNGFQTNQYRIEKEEQQQQQKGHE